MAHGWRGRATLPLDCIPARPPSTWLTAACRKKMQSTVRPGVEVQALSSVVEQNSISSCGKGGKGRRGAVGCNVVRRVG
jgi:hypothetical protein